MAYSTIEIGGLFMILFILALLFSLVSVGVINRNTATISIDAYAKKSVKSTGENGGGGSSGDITKNHAGGNDKGGSDKGGSSNDVRTASDSNDKGGSGHSSNHDPSPSTKDKTPFVLSLPFP